jgi:hypothetical protein
MNRNVCTIDRFDFPEDLVPCRKRYQWNVLSTGVAEGWKVVPHDRHKAWFGAMYLGRGGEIICDGLVLMEKPE